MLKDLNPTTRTFPRTLDEAFPDVHAYDKYLADQQSIYRDDQNSSADFWLMMVASFAAGFLVHLMVTT